MNYKEAKQLFEKAKNKKAGKPLQNNTRLLKIGDDYAVKLHKTNVVIIHPDDTQTLDSGGWRTPTTKDRINEWSSANIYQKNLIWYLENGDLFYDKMVVDENGKALCPVDGQEFEKAKKVIDQMTWEYIKGFCEHLSAGNFKWPSNGDCWGCAFVNAETGKYDPMGLHHYFSHFFDKYFVPSLLANAIVERGYADPATILYMIENDSNEKEDLWLARHALIYFFRKRKIQLAQMLMKGVVLDHGEVLTADNYKEVKKEYQMRAMEENAYNN